MAGTGGGEERERERKRKLVYRSVEVETRSVDEQPRDGGLASKCSSKPNTS